jgi:hypothetical protein
MMEEIIFGFALGMLCGVGIFGLLSNYFERKPDKEAPDGGSGE